MSAAWLRGTPGPGRVWRLAALLAVAAAAGHLALPAAPPGSAALLDLPWPVLLIAVVLAERVTVHLGLGDDGDTASFSLGELPVIVGLVFASPLEVVSATVLGTAIALLRDRQGVLKLTFNVALVWLGTVTAALVWHAALGDADPTGPRGWLAVLAVVAVIDIVSASGVTAAIWGLEGRIDRGTLRDLASSGTAEAVSNGSFAVIAITVLAADWRVLWALIVVLMVLAGAYRAFMALQRQRDRLEDLMGFARALGHDLSAAAVAQTVVSRVAELLPAERVELSWSDGERRWLACADADGNRVAAAAAGAGVADVLGPGTDGRSFIPQTAKDPADRALLERAGARDLISAPLVVADTRIGTLVAVDRSGDVETFDGAAATLLVALATQAAAALDNGRLADRLREEAAERAHEACHDALTGLPNRRAFQEAVTVRVAKDPLAVLILDLDRFKEINDTLGHHTGDLLLGQVGARLASALPSAMVARLGGDEFAVMVPGADLDRARSAAAGLRAVLAETFLLRGLAVHVDASIGIAVAPHDGEDADVLLQRADVAMYTAKAAHTGFEHYAPENDLYSPHRLTLTGELVGAIDTGELCVVYQPKVRASDEAVVGVEALVRWPHPEHGMILPDAFIPIAEQTGLILPLTLFVLSTALEQQRQWAQGGFDLQVAVNVSPRTLLDPALPGHVQRLLTEHGVPADVLTLEITESSLIGDPARTEQVLAGITRLGVGLSIDDFGTGYSSMGYLKRLPVDEIKIDRSFVSSLLTDAEDAAIVTAMVDLARALHKRTVAEGVEDAATWAALRDLGCDVGQGFWFSRPLGGARMGQWLRDRSPSASRAPDASARRARDTLMSLTGEARITPGFVGSKREPGGYDSGAMREGQGEGGADRQSDEGRGRVAARPRRSAL